MQKITFLLLFVIFQIKMYSQISTFTKIDIATAQSQLRDIKPVDMDGDGDMDLLVVKGSNAVWFENTDGLGDFNATPVNIGMVFNTHAATTGDIDGDGDLDVVVASGPYSIPTSEIAWFENLDGIAKNFGPKQSITTQGNNFWDVVANDFDGDGDVDIAFCAYETDAVFWAMNTDGQGTFSTPTTIFTGANGVKFLEMADADNDGDIDLFSSSSLPMSSGQFSQYKNTDGMGSFVKQNVNSSDGNNAMGIAVGDIDTDGDIDFIGTLYNSNAIFRWLNDGTGVFTNKIVVINNISQPTAVRLADIDNDGDLDVFYATEADNKLSYMVNNGSGVFSNPTVVSNQLSFASAFFNNSRLFGLADFNNDGVVDIAATSPGQNSVVWFQHELTIPLSITDINTTNLQCNGGTDGQISVQVSGGVAPYTYSVNGGATNSTGVFLYLTAGVYTVQVQDAAGTTLTETVALTEPPLITAQQVATLCQGESIEVGGQTFNAPGTYQITASAANGCDSIITLSLTYIPPIILTLPPTLAICSNELPTTLNAGPGYASYLWNSGASTQTIPVNLSGLYFVTVTDANGCTGTGSTSVTVDPAPIVNLGADTIVCNYDLPFVIDAGAGNVSYTWNDGTTSQTYTITTICICELSVQVVNSLDCISSDTIVVSVAICDATTEESMSNAVTVFPNPTNGAFDISFKELPNGIFKLTFFNVAFKNVFEREVEINSIEQIIRMDGMPLEKGVYYLQIDSQERQWSTIKKIIII